MTVFYRATIALLWALAAYGSIAHRGLFWDGSSFLVNILEHGQFHDFYSARVHVGWVTQIPVLLFVKLGVTDTNLLSVVYTAALLGIPTGLYHLALFRARTDPALLAIVMVIVAVVYLPTSFFIIGEYNVVFAAATACMMVALTIDGTGWRDGAILCAVGALSLRSYEAMAHLGPLLAAAIVWSTRRSGAPGSATRALGFLAAALFIGAMLVSLLTMFNYWHHPHFTRVRSAVLDFWQNLQFVIPFAALAVFAAVSLIRPSWLGGWGPRLVIGVCAVLLVATPFYRYLNDQSMLFPPAHYVARTAAGALLWALLTTTWLYVAWRRHPPALFMQLRQPVVARRLVRWLFALVIAAAVPDIVLTRMWTQYLDTFRGLVIGRTGLVYVTETKLHDWPGSLFRQDWTYAALSAVVRNAPANAVVLPVPDYANVLPFDPACGLLPKLAGYAWRD